MSDSGSIRLFLCGDVMTGRGIDQILPVPSDPTLHESYMRDARAYVALAEKVNGPIERPVEFRYIWGDALAVLDRSGVDARIINLETSITRSEAFWPEKGINYRMHPGNIGCLTAPQIDCCCLANNHVLDWGHAGLEETLQTLDDAGILHTGAGSNAADAGAPAVIEVPGKGRVLAFSYGMPSSGVPAEWGATNRRPGVNFLQRATDEAAATIASDIRRLKAEGDVAVASIHWGSNWGYELREQEIRFAHRLIDGGVDIVHGHSSHHVKTVELYRNGLVLYGCGDFLNDYEGIEGYEEFRSDLTLMYLVTVDPSKRRPIEAQLIPMQVARFRLNHASQQDSEWLCQRLSELGARRGTSFRISDGMIIPSRSGSGPSAA